MQFKLKKLDKASTRQFAPYSQIIEHIYCDKCNTRETSSLSVGFTLLGIQFFCDNCEKSVLHIALNDGEYTVDPFSHGRFNKRNMTKGVERMNKYSLELSGLGCLTSTDLLEKKKEQETNDYGYEHDIRHTTSYNS
jgi:transcription elongation factor Elf1